MKIDQMHYNFYLGVDRINSYGKEDFQAWEIDEYLNRAVWIFLKNRYDIDPNKRGFETDQKRIDELKNLHIKSPELQDGVTPIDLGNGRYELRLNDLGNNINGQYFRYLFLTGGYIEAKKGNCTKCITINHLQTDDRVSHFTDSNFKWCRVNYNLGRSTFKQKYRTDNDTCNDPDETMDLCDGCENTNVDLGSIYFDTNNKNKIPQFEINKVFISYIKYPNRLFKGGYDHIDGLSKKDGRKIDLDLDSGFADEIVRIAVNLAIEDISGDYNIKLNRELEDRELLKG